jgi:hypothetical protein
MMDKKKPGRRIEPDDVRGFEEFIEGQSSDKSFMPKAVGGTKKVESGFEHFTFLKNDAERLTKLKLLLSEKLPFSEKFDQSAKLIKVQQEELDMTKQDLFNLCDKENSPYRKSISDIFNSFFDPSQG